MRHFWMECKTISEICLFLKFLSSIICSHVYRPRIHWLYLITLWMDTVMVVRTLCAVISTLSPFVHWAYAMTTYFAVYYVERDGQRKGICCISVPVDDHHCGRCLCVFSGIAPAVWLKQCVWLRYPAVTASLVTGRRRTLPLHIVGYEVMDIMNGNGLHGAHGEHHKTWSDMVWYPLASAIWTYDLSLQLSLCSIVFVVEVLWSVILCNGRCMCMLLSFREDWMPLTRDYNHGLSLLVSSSSWRGLPIIG